MQRFKFYLKSANIYESLKGQGGEEADARYIQDIQKVWNELKDNPGIFQIPKPHKMHATDIDFKTGAKKQRARLYCAGHSLEGQAAQ
ncbi:hypothetical protein MAM1_0059d03746 [Mucor ambiguus]|uniref:Uncharacterized protein n=1 Tax=Mucor ambiguus TaxID=91626 RepID=A0A0C9M4Q5_9FUNG|nr:hypothetical protein MAM1_0059d03746 [Mucor ambiguus]